MRTQQIDLNGERLSFGPGPSRRLCGIAVVIAGLIAAALIPYSGTSLPVGLIWAICGICLLFGYWMAFDASKIELHPVSGSYRRARGPWPFTRRIDRALSEFDRLALEVTPEMDVYGEERQLRSLFMEGVSLRLPLFRHLDTPDTVQAAEKVAAALGWPAPAEVIVTRSRRPLIQRGITYGAWGVMLCLAIILVWPARSAPRRRSVAATSLPLAMRRDDGAGSHSRRAQALYFQRQFKESEKEYRRALELAPGTPEYLNMLAYALAEQNKLQQALQVAQKALKAAPQDWMIIDTVAEMHQRRKEWATAAAYYESALRRTPGGGKNETQCKYGETLIALGRKGEAVTQLTRALGGERLWADRARVALARLGINAGPQRRLGPIEAPIQGTARPTVRRPVLQ